MKKKILIVIIVFISILIYPFINDSKSYIEVDPTHYEGEVYGYVNHNDPDNFIDYKKFNASKKFFKIDMVNNKKDSLNFYITENPYETKHLIVHYSKGSFHFYKLEPKRTYKFDLRKLE